MSDEPSPLLRAPLRTEAEALAASVIRHVTTLQARGVLSADAAGELRAFIEGRIARPSSSSSGSAR